MSTGISAPKVISLCVRPWQVAHLCFEVGGILGEMTTKLGARVDAFDFDEFYAELGSFPTTGDPSRYLWTRANPGLCISAHSWLRCGRSLRKQS